MGDMIAYQELDLGLAVPEDQSHRHCASLITVLSG